MAQRFAHAVDAEPTLEPLAPVALNIVCFRVRGRPDTFNADIVAELQEHGIAAPSTTVIDGTLAIRAAIVNHRPTDHDVDASGVVRAARTRDVAAA